MGKKVAFGKFGRAHGLKGEVRFWCYRQQGDSEILAPGLSGLVVKSRNEGLASVLEIESGTSIIIKKVRHTPKYTILTLEGSRYRDQAEALLHKELYIDRSLFPEPDDDEIYLTDLIDLPVYIRVDKGSDKDEPLWALSPAVGHVHSIMETKANDVLVVTLNNEERLLVPMVDHALAELDPSQKRVVLAPLEQWASQDMTLEELL